MAHCPLWQCPNPMRRIILFALVLALTVTPCHALTLFQADYDGDRYTTETVYEGDWLPLRKLSETLPYTVEWKNRTVYIYAERTHTIRPDWYLPEGVCIRDGVTYVSPVYLRMVLSGRCFLFEDELYVFDGETVRSQLVRGGADFRAHTLTVLYRLRLALPEDYQLIRNSLTGGIEETVLPEGLPYGTQAFVYPTKARPTAHIVANCKGTELAELIAHEAYHVYLERHDQQIEEKAREYGQRVKQDLLNIT